MVVGGEGGNSAVLARPGPPSSSLWRAALRCADLGGNMGAGKRSSDALSTRVGVRMLRRIRELRAVKVRHIRVGHVIGRVAPRADRAFGDEAVLLEPLARRDLIPQACAPGGWGEVATACAVRCPWARAAGCGRGWLTFNVLEPVLRKRAGGSCAEARIHFAEVSRLSDPSNVGRVDPFHEEGGRVARLIGARALDDGRRSSHRAMRVPTESSVPLYQ